LFVFGLVALWWHLHEQAVTEKDCVRRTEREKERRQGLKVGKENEKMLK
jgi:hypothetical protein